MSIRDDKEETYNEDKLVLETFLALGGGLIGLLQLSPDQKNSLCYFYFFLFFYSGFAVCFLRFAWNLFCRYRHNQLNTADLDKLKEIKQYFFFKDRWAVDYRWYIGTTFFFLAILVIKIQSMWKL